MKKRLLMMALTMVTGVGAFAYNAGDYIYTMTAKYKAIENNLVQNGAFSEGVGGLEGWTNEAGGELSSAAWEVTTNAKDGLAALSSVSAAADGENVGVMRAWTGMSGIYAISFWIKANEATVSAVTAGNTNYIDFFVNATGVADKTDSRQVAEAFSFNNEWTQVVDTVEMHEGDYLVFVASKVSEGTLMTDFQINKVSQVYDTRNVDRLIAYAEKLLAEPDLTEGKDEFAGLVEMMKEAIQDPTQNENIEAMEDLLAQFNERFDEFMNQNGGNTVGTVGSWEKNSPGYLNVKNLSAIGSWSFAGGRWGFTANTTALDWKEGDGYIATALIQTGYTLNGSSVKVSNTALDPGKYFFAIEAQAVGAGWAKPGDHNWSYGTNHNLVVAGPTMYVGSDTIVMRPATEEELAAIANGSNMKKYTDETEVINGYYWKKFYMIGEVKEGNTVEAGFIFPDVTGTPGGRYSLRNPEFRMIGKTEQQLKFEAAAKEVVTQQKALDSRLKNYPNDVADLKWGKDSLERAIVSAQSILESSLEVVDSATAKCVLPVTDENLALLGSLSGKDGLVGDLLAQVNAMNSAKNYITNSNAVQETLKNAIADANKSLTSELTTGAPADKREALSTITAAGQKLIDELAEVTGVENVAAKIDEFTLVINEINSAKESFDVSVASRNFPANIQIENASFEKNSKNINTAGTFTNNGWTYTSAGDYKQWQFSKSAEYEGGGNCNQWRGHTVSPAGKAQQYVTITMPGLYEYRSQAYATNDDLAKRMNTAVELLNDEGVGNDTTYYATPVRMFFGEDGAPDSVVVSKLVAYKGWQNVTAYTPWHYSVFFVKTGSEPVKLEFGLEAIAVGVPNGMCGFGFGSNQILFLGDEAKYIADTDNDLNALIAKAEPLIAANEGTEGYGFLAVKAKRYVADAKAATTVKAKQNAYLSLKEIVELLGGDVDGISEAKTSEPVVAGKMTGIYTIGGVMVQSANLKPGMYVKDGKVFVVK